MARTRNRKSSELFISATTLNAPMAYNSAWQFPTDATVRGGWQWHASASDRGRTAGMAVTLIYDHGDREPEGEYPGIPSATKARIGGDAGSTHRDARYTIFEREILPVERIPYSSGMDMSQSHTNAYAQSVRGAWTGLVRLTPRLAAYT